VDAWGEERGAVEVAGGGEDGDRQGHRLEEPEQRAKGVLQDQREVIPAAGGGEEERLVRECVLVDEVGEVLEQVGVGAAEHRGGGYEQVGLLGAAERVLDL